jgi:hypothetical protein
MRTASFLVPGFLLLAACTPAATPDNNAASSSSALSSMDVSSLSMQNSSIADQAWVVVKAWAPSLTWSAPSAGTNDDALTDDMQHTIPAKAIQVQSISSSVLSVDQYSTIFMAGASRNALDIAVAAQGWKVDKNLDADGVTGTQWGSVRSSQDGMRFLVLSADAKDCTDSSDAPTQCSTFIGKVTVTDAMAAGDDL